MRTNGFAALANMDTINTCTGTIGYSIHTLCPVTSKMMIGKADVPEWSRILNETKAPCRVSIVVTRCNRHEVFDLVRFLATFDNVKYVQVRRVSTDRRLDLLAPDMVAYEEVYTTARQVFPMKRTLWGDADEFIIYDKPVVFWRTIKTSVNSLNYFTDGTISDLYFIVEGYLKGQALSSGPDPAQEM